MTIIFYILCLALQVFTIIHAWKNLPFSKFVKVLCTIIILIFSWIAVVIYWIYYGLKGPNNHAIIKQETQIENAVLQETNNTYEDDAHAPEENAEKEQNARLLFNEVMNGVNSKALSESYEKVMNMFIMKENGECKGAGFTGLLDEKDRAKRLEKIDNQIVLPALGHNPDMYKAWWTTVYYDVCSRMQNSPNKQQIMMLEQVLSDVERGDELLEISGASEYMRDYRTNDVEILKENVTLTNMRGREVNTSVIFKSKNEGKNIKITTLDDTIKIKRQEKRGKIYYEIKGAYEYFYLGLSDDDLIRIAEILIAVPSILQFSLKNGINKVWMEEYEMPSLSKLTANS